MIALLVLAGMWTVGTPERVVDLRPEWKVLVREAYQSPDPDHLDTCRTIYFPVNARMHGGHHLVLTSPEPAYVFINGQLLGSFDQRAGYSIDTLRQEFGERLWVAVYAPGNLAGLTTEVFFYRGDAAAEIPPLFPRPPTFFRDYGILVAVFLVFFFLLLYRTNPQLTLDYFSFSRVFSSSERNETQLASRITSSENLLFYLFCALFAGFLLSAILYSTGPFFQAARPLTFTSLGASFLIWGRLSLFILLLLAAKLSLVLVFSTLFNFRETVSFQFFNFLRFVLFTSMVLALLSLVLFVFQVSAAAWYERLIGIGLTLLTIGSGMVLMKLLRKSRLSFFHLFSYLCISEFIPLVILFKIFF